MGFYLFLKIIIIFIERSVIFILILYYLLLFFCLYIVEKNKIFIRYIYYDIFLYFVWCKGNGNYVNVFDKEIFYNIINWNYVER